MELTEDIVRAECRKHGLFVTPQLNEVIYCNSGGFTSMSGLQSYVNVKSLFFECNQLADLASLPPLPRLKCLYLQNNALTSLAGLMTKAPELHTLNVSGNQHLTSLVDLSGSRLQILQCAHNRLQSVKSIEALSTCISLQTLDLQGNQLDDFEGVMRILSALPALKCLYLADNPIVKSTSDYRRRVLRALPNLIYFDDHPVATA